MKLEHLAIWARDIEVLRRFYEMYFGATSSEKYVNSAKKFESYFLSFESGARLELMHRPDINKRRNDFEDGECLGYAHLAISVESELKVDALTNRLTSDGYSCIDGPRRTGDKCYESAILDPEGNRIEITS